MEDEFVALPLEWKKSLGIPAEMTTHLTVSDATVAAPAAAKRIRHSTISIIQTAIHKTMKSSTSFYSPIHELSMIFIKCGLAALLAVMEWGSEIFLRYEWGRG